MRGVIAAMLLSCLGGARFLEAQNLLPNAHFTTGIAPWSFVGGVGQADFDPAYDADGFGGSLRLRSDFGDLEARAGVCVPVSAGTVYSWGGSALLEARYPAETAANFALEFYADDACTQETGVAVSSSGLFHLPNHPETDELDRWYALAGPEIAAPPSAHSARFTALLGTTLDVFPHATNFDDVYLGRQGTVPGRLLPDIDTLSITGMLALTAGLGAAALWLLRSRAT
jgi:hypothetical protein